MKIDLSGQIIIVTGAGRGIGRELALMLAEAGATAILVARTFDQIASVASEITARSGHAIPIKADVANSSAVHEVVKSTLQSFGRIDGLVNNAASNYIASVVMSREEDVRHLFEINVLAVFFCTQAVLRPMIRQRSGRIINISSVSAKVGAAYNAAYASSKAAVIGFTKSVAKETAKLGITCNAICPWHVDTELVRSAMGERGRLFGKTADEYLAEIVRNSPQGRMITSREVGAMALLLMSHEGRGITGQALNICGGYAMD